MSTEKNHNALFGQICNVIPTVCENIVKFIVGFTENENLNKSRLSVIASHEPGGTSLKTLNHW